MPNFILGKNKRSRETNSDKLLVRLWDEDGKIDLMVGNYCVVGIEKSSGKLVRYGGLPDTLGLKLNPDKSCVMKDI